MAKTNEDTTGGAFTLTQEQFAALLSKVSGAGNGLTPDTLEKILAAQGSAVSEGMRKAMKPENPQAPLISVYNPKGDRDHPRPALKCKMFLRAYPIDGTTESVEELELLNQLQPGTYWFHDMSGRKVKMPVVAETTNTGELSRLLILLPMEEDDRMAYPGFATILREALGLGMPDQAAMAAELAALRAKVASLDGQAVA